MIEVNLNLTKLHAMHLLAASKDIRFYLCGVYIEATASETRMCATNGHYAGMLRKANDLPNACEWEHFILPSDVVAKMKHAKGTPDMATVLVDKCRFPEGDPEHLPTRYTVRLWDGTLIPFQPLAGDQFPHIRRVMPSEMSTSEPTAFDAEYLLLFAKVNKAFGQKKGGYLNIGWHGQGNAMSIRLPYVPDFAGILMGLREPSDPFKLDAWPDKGAEVDVPASEHEAVSS